MAAITVTAQHLDGNSPEGFDNAAWCEALRNEFARIVHHYLPDADVTVEIDRQRNTEGAANGADVFADDDTVIPADLTRAVEQAANSLFDARGDEFYATER